MSQPDATADAANASSTGSGTATALDAFVDTTSALASVFAATAGASPSERVQVESARPQTSLAPPSISGTVACSGGGTATMTVSGTLELLRNG